MACGKLHVEVLPEDFSGENAKGAEVLVQKVRAEVNKHQKWFGQIVAKGSTTALAGQDKSGRGLGANLNGWQRGGYSRRCTWIGLVLARYENLHVPAGPFQY